VTPRSRILAFGSAAALVAIGAMSAVLIGGSTGGAIAIALISVGLGGALLLVFLEVGLSEERQLAKEEERRRRCAKRRTHPARRRIPRWPRRPS
jgi:hypothetical protein